MQICVAVLWHVVVKDDVDSFDIHSSAEEIGGHKDSLLEIFELLISGQTVFLSHGSMNSDSGEILFHQELRQRNTSLDTLNEYYDL